MLNLLELKAWVTAHKYTVIGYFVLVATFVVMFLTIVDYRRQNKALEAQVATSEVDFKKVGDAYQAQGLLYKSEKQAADAAKAAFGKQLAEAMDKDQAKIRALYVSNGQLKDELNGIHQTVVTPTSTGAFTNVSLAQVRTGPALTEVELNYDPTNKDAKSRLTGNWLSYREDFVSTVGEWEKKDKGFIATMRLQRTVLKPDGKGGYTVVGVEEIPLTGATATFGPVAFGGDQAINPVPRFSVYAGGGWDTSQHKAVPVLGFDYRLTTNVGVGSGIAGNIVFGTLSYRFGKQ